MRTVIEITVKLQKPMQYSLIALIIALLVVLAPLIWQLIKYIKSKNNAPKVIKEKEAPKEVFVPRKTLYQLKEEYIKLIDAIEKKYINSEIDSRELHLELSSAVKKFVEEVTGVSASSFVLSDFAKHKMPTIEGLLEVFYAPEFAPESVMEQQSADNARKVVREWN